MILGNICISSRDLLECLAEELYNKKHNRCHYFDTKNDLLCSILSDCPKYRTWWNQGKRKTSYIYYCYLKTNGKDVCPAFERCSEWNKKTIRLDQSIIIAGQKRLNKILQKREIKEINMEKDCDYSAAKAKEFYNSDEWRHLRYFALKSSDGKCSLCGRSAKDGVVLQVDHIVPLSVSWGLRNKKSNLQVLCRECNLGKSNKDYTSWKKKN